MAVTNKTLLCTIKWTPKITVGAGSVTGVPMPFGLSTHSQATIDYIFKNCRCDGFDIAFTMMGDTTELKYFRDNHNKDTNEMQYWVAVTGELNASEIYVDVYGNEPTDDTDDSTTDVFSDQNIIRRWSCNDIDTASEWLDTSGSGQNLTVNGNPTKIDGIHGTAHNLDGSGDYGDQTYFTDINGTSFYIETLAKKNSNGADGYLMSMGEQTNNKGLHFGFENTNLLRFSFWGADAVDDTDEDYDTARFIHFSGNYDKLSTTMSIYRSGLHRASNASVSSDLNVTSNDFNLGRRRPGSTDAWNGYMDESRVHTVSRSAEWIQCNANALENPKAHFSSDLTPKELGWTSKVTATINTSSLGSLDGGSAITDFPVPFLIQSGDVDDMHEGKTKALSGLGDLIAVMNGDLYYDDRIPIDVRRHEQDNKLAVVLVRVPDNVNNQSSVQVDFYWGRGLTEQPARPGLKSLERVMPDDCSGCWPLNQTTGDDAVDHSVYQRDGSNTGNPQQIDGEFDYAQEFDNSGSPDDRFVTVDATDFEGGNENPPLAFSVSAWVRLDGSPSSRVICGKRNDGGSQDGWVIQVLGSQVLRFVLDRGASQIDADGTTSIDNTDSVIYHVMATYDGSGNDTGLKVYLNGVDDTASVSGGALGGSISNSSEFTIGGQNNSNSNNWDGLIQEVRHYLSNKTAGWAKLEFELIRNQSTFVSWGAVQDIGDAPEISGWSYFEDVQIQPESQFNDATEGPIVITEKSMYKAMEMFSQSQEDGYDIRIVQNGAEIPHELVFYERTVKGFEMHVYGERSQPIRILWGASDMLKPNVPDSPVGLQYVYPNDVCTYHFGDRNGTVITDSSKNQLHGTWNQDIDFRHDQGIWRSQSVLKRANSEYGEVPYSALMDVPAEEDFTHILMCRFYSVDGADLCVAGRKNGGNGFEFEIENAIDGRFWAMFNGTTYKVVSDEYLVPDKDYVFVARRKDNWCSLWINGVKQGTDIYVPVSLSSTSVLSFGRDPQGANEYHDGTIEEYRLVVGEALCEDEIKAISVNYTDPELVFKGEITHKDLLDCCEEGKNTGAGSAVAFRNDCAKLLKEFQGMKADLRLLIAATERMKKGRL